MKLSETAYIIVGQGDSTIHASAWGDSCQIVIQCSKTLTQAGAECWTSEEGVTKEGTSKQAFSCRAGGRLGHSPDEISISFAGFVAQEKMSIG